MQNENNSSMFKAVFLFSDVQVNCLVEKSARFIDRGRFGRLAKI